MRDFTLDIYERLLVSLRDAGYEFLTFAEYCEAVKGQKSKVVGQETLNFQLLIPNKPKVLTDKFVILRHDVDDKAMRALAVAGCEFRVSNSCKASYYFRAVSCEQRAISDEGIIREIAAMGHEVGYHYEDWASEKGIVKRATESFREHLIKLNKTLVAGPWPLGKSIINDELLIINDGHSSAETQHADVSTKAQNLQPSTLNDSLTSDQRLVTSDLHKVRTVSMHGSALSKYDNLELWKHTSLEEHGLIGEAYMTTDWNDVFYLTDTGRRWDGWHTSVRDRIPGHQERWMAEGLVYRTTEDIIETVKNGTFPKRVMMTVHPQRWNDRWLPWLKELVGQRIKNLIKFLIARRFLIARI